MTWTEARIAQLSQLWAAGVSAAGIAEALGDVSRSAVLGKLHRLKLLRSRNAASAPRRYEGPLLGAVQGGARPASGRPPPREPARGTPPEPPRSPWREAAFAPLPGTMPRPWLTREFGECAFPVGGEGEALVACCAAAKPRSAYCAAHHAVVFKARQADEPRRWAQAVERWAA